MGIRVYTHIHAARPFSSLCQNVQNLLLLSRGLRTGKGLAEEPDRRASRSAPSRPGCVTLSESSDLAQSTC